MGTIQLDPVNFRRDSARRKNEKIEIQTLWENSDPLGAIVRHAAGNQKGRSCLPVTGGIKKA